MTLPPFGHIGVAIEPTALDRSRAGHVFGPIRLRYDASGTAAAWFPEEDSTDFAVVLLGWWIEQFAALKDGESEEARCGFMDGPLAFTVRSVDPETCRVRCV